MLHHLFCNRRNDLGVSEGEHSLVICCRPFLLSQTDGHHFQQTAFKIMLKFGMFFNSIYQYDMVCFRSQLVNEYGDARIGFPDLNHVQ